MKELTYKISLNDKSYSIKAVINEDDYSLLLKYNPHLIIPNLLITDSMNGDVQNISLAAFQIKDVPSDTKEYVEDPRKVLQRMIKKAKIKEEDGWILPPDVPNKEGYYDVTIYNILNPFNERMESLYFSEKLGWMATKEDELAYSWSIKYWLA